MTQPAPMPKHRRALLRAKLAYIRAHYLLAKHSNKVLLGLLQRAHPDFPWKNIAYASKHA